MALLDHQTVDADGDVTLAAADVAGDSYALTDDSSALLVVNGDAGAHTVTLAVPATFQGLDVPDRVVNVPAGGVALIPLSRRTYRDGGTGEASWTYDAVTSVQVAVVRL